ncbi:MAG: hypothetical protein H0U70_10190 [Tatlockia sp.]|nr:hypothetical protein [Tatlockia sp.]
MLVSEKNRFQAPRADVIKESCRIMIESITSQIIAVTDEINLLIKQDSSPSNCIRIVPGAQLRPLTYEPIVQRHPQAPITNACLSCSF